MDHQQSHSAMASPIHIAAELERLYSSDNWRRGTHVARTLTKMADLRLVLVALPAGGRLATHQAPGGITIHTVCGEVRVGLPNREVCVPYGHALAIEAGVKHEVNAPVESAFLLTIAASPGEAAPVESGTEGV